MYSNAAHIELPDGGDRELAIRTFNRNVVVTAGAGTGKTTLLVDRLVHLLMRNPEPLKITEIVALTFTNKAADEMRLRLRERLHGYLAETLDRPPISDAEGRIRQEIESLLTLYRLSKDELDDRAREALRTMERSDIGTIHSFAASLLRLYPLEADVDPQFHEDDGAAFERIFDEQWNVWLDRELALDSPRAAEWRAILACCRLDQIKGLAAALAAETVDLRPRAGASMMPGALSDWLSKLETKGVDLVERHPEDRTNERLLRAATAVISACKNGRPSQNLTQECALLSEKSINPNLGGWSEAEIMEARDVVRAGRGLVHVQDDLIEILRRLLVPFAADFRERFVGEGHISFDGLLVRARNLVRDQPRVRAELKQRYLAILVDEFQDTDPIQYEILLYLAEQHQQAATDWRLVKLLPGKIFVVGDPKQSIYAFRRADIEAYLEVVEKIIKAQDGIECRLTTNFRSNAVILNAVNGTFVSLMRAQPGLQPPYIAIHPAPQRTTTLSGIAKVMVRKIVSEDPNMDAETARRLEGQSLARWLSERVLEKTLIVNSAGERVYARPKDVALLFRKLTDIHDYLEPLRRQGIRYLVEGERHFYAAKEIIDTVNLLRAVENAHDRLALVGVLRSPLGGLTDRQIYELHRLNLLDYRAAAKISEKDFPQTLVQLYGTLTRLHQEIHVMPIGAAMAHLLATLPVELLAASQFNGEQAVANLQKLQQQADLLGREGTMTLKKAVRQLEQRVLEIKDEGESVLAEENVDAVRLMSIHKAKGLEFPIVVLAGCHAGSEARRAIGAEVLSDWSTGLTGLRIGPVSDLSGLYIAEKTRVRNNEEQKRLLYVAMTRARENLIVSCAPTSRRSRGSFLSMLDDAVDGRIANAQSSVSVPLGNDLVEIDVVREDLAAPVRRPRAPALAKTQPHWQPFVDAWARRAATYDQAQHAVSFLTPTYLKRQEEIHSEARAEYTNGGQHGAPALTLGDLAHRFLQRWDFQCDIRNFAVQLNEFTGEALARESSSFRRKIEVELQDIFSCFFLSEAYAELAKSRVLGREVPLLMPWNRQIMEGVIDVIYERRGRLYLADYKSDRVDPADVAEAAERYRQQAEIYTRAARQALKREIAAFKLIFLRLGAAVEIPTSGVQGELFT
jgi:ATP-dependent helicase/nuclease subunit A